MSSAWSAPNRPVVSLKSLTVAPSGLFSLAYSWPVVPVCTPIVLPARSARDFTSESFGTSSDWSASKYGSVKSISFSRSGVMETDEATRSQLPAAMEAKIVSKSLSFTEILSPMDSAMASTSSMSKPVYWRPRGPSPSISIGA